MNAKRLLKLADHLEFGELGHNMFDFSYFETECGTAGCAIGECPKLWPNIWNWKTIFGREVPCIKDGATGKVAAMCFFDIDPCSINFLFDPNYRDTCPLPEKATRYQVAMHIRRFVREGKIYWTKAS